MPTQPISSLTLIAQPFLAHMPHKQAGHYYKAKGIKYQFTLTHEKNGMRFSSAELRPNGRDFLEQFREAVGKRRRRDQAGPILPGSGEVEM